MNPSPPSPSASRQPWFPHCTIHPLPSLPPPRSLEETICPSAKAERCVWKDLPGSLTCYIFNKEDHILALASPPCLPRSPAIISQHTGDGLMSSLHVTRSPPFPKFHKSTPEGCPQKHLFTVPPHLPSLLPGLPQAAPWPPPACHHLPCPLHSSGQSQCWTGCEQRRASVSPQGKQPQAGSLPGLEAMVGRTPLETAWMAPT